MNVRPALELLRDWARPAERWWHALPDSSGLGCYGTGYSNWGVQTNQKYAGAMAALAALGQDLPGAERERALERSLAALRFSLATHLTGSRNLLDGGRWGQTWISVLGLERMLYGVRLIERHLREEDRAALRRVICGEADWIARKHERGKLKGVFGTRWAHEGGNAPESNLWNGAFLWRAACYCPDHSDAAAWREMAHRFLINALSIPEDAQNRSLLAGKPVCERFAGPNYFSHFALDHHGYLNVGYMMICASNAAILHFDCQAAGWKRPESLDHHQQEHWTVLRRMIFSDGRLARIGGDSRVRYAYCQEYLPPAALYAAERWRDLHALGLVERYLDLVRRELAFSPDGSFYGGRLGEMAAQNAYYYTRLESDRACALGMIAAYAPLVEAPQAPKETFEQSTAGGWIEPEHGAVLHRSPTRLASYSWRAYGLGQGMCQPPDEGHLADWQQNLGGRIEFSADEDGKAHRRLERGEVAAFEGGFLAWGAIREGVDLTQAEGWKGTDSGLHQIVFAALPDGRSAVGLEYAVCGPRRAWLRAVQGMHWLLPNDGFNDFSRKLEVEGRWVELKSPPPDESLLRLGSRWACVDGKVGVLGLYGGNELSVHRVPWRRGGKYRSLFVEAVGWPSRVGLWAADPGEVLLDAGWMVCSSVRVAEVRALAQANRAASLALSAPGLRGVKVLGCDGQGYGLIANFGAEPATLHPAQALACARAEDLLEGGTATAQAHTHTLNPGQARIWRCETA